jgi:hypothetical protein
VLGREGNASQPLTVAYAVTGPIEPATGIATFEAGSSSTTVDLTPTATANSGDVIHFSLTSSPDYSLGDPSGTDLTIGAFTDECTVPAPESAPPPVTRRELLPATGAPSHLTAAIAAACLLLIVGSAMRRRATSIRNN